MNDEIEAVDQEAPKRGRPSYADVKAQLDDALQKVDELTHANAELASANADLQAQLVGGVEAVEEPQVAPAGPRKRVKILIHKKMTSMGRVLGGHFEELPVDEANAMIEAGEAEAA